MITANDAGSVIGMFGATGQGDEAAIGQLYRVLYTERRGLTHQSVRSLDNVRMLDTTSLVSVTDRTVRRALEKARLLLLDALS